MHMKSSRVYLPNGDDAERICMLPLRQYLTEDATKTLVNSCILSSLDYCNSLLAGYPQTVIKPLQQVQNSAAKLILTSHRAEHTKLFSSNCTGSPKNRELNTKQIASAIKSSLAQPLSTWLNLFRCTSLLGLCTLLWMIKTFCIPFFKRKQHGGRAFCISAVQIWNSLPFAFHHSPSLPAFKISLKTYLFKQYFDQ